MPLLSDSERCYATAMRILNVRFNSEAELRRKLSARQYTPEDIAVTMDRLRREKWLDDRRFAEGRVRSRLRRRIGPIRIRRELTAAGVDVEVVAAAMQVNADAEAERETLQALCARKIAMIKRRHGAAHVRSDEGRRKLAAYLLSQGYGTALVLETIKNCLKRLADDEAERAD